MFESMGLLRTIGSVLSGVGVILKAVGYPETGLILLEVGGAIGGTGVVRAAAQGTLWDMKKNKLDEK